MTEPMSRPAALSRASWFLLAVSAAGIVQAVVSRLERDRLEIGLVEVGKYMNVDQALYRTIDLRGSLSLAFGLGACAAVVGAGLVPLLRQGRRWSRVITWIAATALVVGEVVLMAADTNAVKTGDFITPTDVPGGNLDTVAMLNSLLVPDWFPPLYYLAEFVVLAGLIATCVQLVRPETSDFFNRDKLGVGSDAPPDPRVWSVPRSSPEDPVP